jgi:chromate transporter
MPKEAASTPRAGLWELVGYFLRLGSLGFGGPIALAGYMQRDLVPRGWITSEEYKEGLAFAQMMPGPLAAQLAMWIGFIRHGVVGASLIGIVFILPPYLIVVVIAALYVDYNGLAAVQALFYGIGPAVIAIIAISAVRLARATVEKDVRLWIIFGVIAAITFFSRTEVALLFVAAGLIGIVLYAPFWKKNGHPPVQSMIFLAASTVQMTASRLGQLGTFFVKAGAFGDDNIGGP